MEDGYKKVIEAINRNRSFLIVSHAHPDGDGIGSTLALGRALEYLGKKIVMYNQDGVPKAVDFMAGANRLVTTISKDARFDVTLMVDCAQPERAGKDFPPKERRGMLVCIDHHTTGGNEAEVVCQDENASSTGEVVYNILKKMPVTMDAEIATMILTTIIVDTGFFRYSNASSHALRMAAELVEMGASTWVVCKNMEEQNPPEQLGLLRLTLETVEYLLNGRLAVMTLTQQMFKRAGANVDAAEEFINFPRSIDGVEVAVLIREKARNEYKISFRSKDVVDVAALVARFGGGGHKHAAGCDLKGSLGLVKQQVVKAVSEVF